MTGFFHSYGLNVVVCQISLTEQLLFFPRTVPLQPGCILMLHYISTIYCYHDKAYIYCQLGLKN